MSYKDKPQIRLYKYDSGFTLLAIIDDFQECSFQDSRYSAGEFLITINYNLPNALLFERGLFVQFGTDSKKFGEILTITDSIGADGKGSQIRTITGFDARYLFKRRIIKNLNNVTDWTMTGKGELCMRHLIYDQCGAGAEAERRLPITNTIPSESNAIGKGVSIAEAFTNLYEVLETTATQAGIGWRVLFENNSLTLSFEAGNDLRYTVRLDTDFDSLAEGEFSDSTENFANIVYVGGKGTGDERDIYEGASLVGEGYLSLYSDDSGFLVLDDYENYLVIDGAVPSALDRYESWDNQSSMSTTEEYKAEAYGKLQEFTETLSVSGRGLAKCPYIYGEEYQVGDIVTIHFSDRSAVVQILSVTEHWTWGAYDIDFEFGKPINTLQSQLQLMLKQIQKASETTNTTDSVMWYTIPTDTEMSSAEVAYNTIGFVGDVGNGATFKLYLDDEKTGAKTYHVYLKQLGGTGNLTLTTGKAGASNLTLSSGTYVAIISVDSSGNILSGGSTATSSITSGSSQPVTSGAVADALASCITLSNIITESYSGTQITVSSSSDSSWSLSATKTGYYPIAVSFYHGWSSSVNANFEGYTFSSGYVNINGFARSVTGGNSPFLPRMLVTWVKEV